MDWLIQVKEIETRDEVAVFNCSRSLIHLLTLALAHSLMQLVFMINR